MTMPTAKRRPSARFAKLYAGAWIALATLATAYVVTLTVQPSLLGDVTAGRAPADSDGNTAIARFATDLTGLKQSVGDIKSDVASLRTAVETSATREKEVVERLAAVEARSKTQVASADAAAPPAAAPAPAATPKTAAQRQAEARAKKAAERVAANAAVPTETAVIAPSPVASNVTVLNAPVTPAATNPMSTGSIQSLPAPAQGVPAPPPPAAAATVAPSFGPGAVKASVPTQPSGVELASGPSLDALRLNWSLLADQNGNLKSLEPRYTNAGEGQPFQLVAGPIGSPEEAARVCAQLKAKRVSCRVTGFVGNAL